VVLMLDYETISHDDFIQLPTEEIAKIINRLGRPKSGVFLSDGSRRSAMVFWGLKPEHESFEESYIEVGSKQFLDNLKMIFDHGLETIMIPSLKHENYNRYKKNIDAIIYKAIKTMLIGETWVKFYEDYNVKVKIYGDLEYVKQKGYPEIYEWAKEIEERTKNNTTHKLFHGLACSNFYEHRRLMDLAVDFYIENNRKPNEQEKIRLYFGDDMEDVDFLIRSTEIRDSDLQPPIISGRKTQMYFLVAPDHISFSQNVFREILYDLLYSRLPAFGKKEYKDIDYSESNLKFIKEYYSLNKTKIFGIGKKIGPFWIPIINIELPTNKD
jgi:undecaprenyl diphosphate synthase